MKMMKDWKKVKLGEVLKSTNNSIEIKPFEKYKLLGLSLEGRGLFVREEKLGSEISSKFTNKVVSNQFIYSVCLLGKVHLIMLDQNLKVVIVLMNF